MAAETKEYPSFVSGHPLHLGQDSHTTAPEANKNPETEMWTKSKFFLFLWCCTGIYVCFMVYGVLQEKLYTKNFAKDHIAFAVYVLFVQCLANSGLSLLVLLWKSPQQARSIFFDLPTVEQTREFVLLSFAFIGSVVTANHALKYVDFPTQALAKSCKTVPVMLMGVLIRGKKYTFIEYSCVVIMTLGISIFRVAAGVDKDGKETQLEGVILLFCSLLCDAVLSPKQEKIMVEQKLSAEVLMLQMNGWCVILLGLVLALWKEGRFGFTLTQDNPELIQDLILLAVSSAFGQVFILYTIQHFSALLLTIVTTTRKLFTILASVVLYRHKILPLQWFGVGLVFFSIVAQICEKQYRQRKLFFLLQKSKNAQPHDTHADIEMVDKPKHNGDDSVENIEQDIDLEENANENSKLLR